MVLACLLGTQFLTNPLPDSQLHFPHLLICLLSGTLVPISHFLPDSTQSCLSSFAHWELSSQELQSIPQPGTPVPQNPASGQQLYLSADQHFTGNSVPDLSPSSRQTCAVTALLGSFLPGTPVPAKPHSSRQPLANSAMPAMPFYWEPSSCPSTSFQTTTPAIRNSSSPHCPTDHLLISQQCQLNQPPHWKPSSCQTEKGTKKELKS